MNDDAEDEAPPESVHVDALDGETDFNHAYYCVTCDTALRTEVAHEHTGADHEGGYAHLVRVEVVHGDYEADVRTDGGESLTVKGMRSVEVVTASGDCRVTLGVNHHVHALLVEALARVEQYPHDIGNYDLVDENGDVLDVRHTLGSAGVEDGATLYVDVNPVAIDGGMTANPERCDDCGAPLVNDECARGCDE